MESELERAKVKLNSAQDALMDAQLTWAHAHRDWLQAVNKSARGVASEGAMCGYTRTENREPLDWSQCAVCQNVRWVGRVTSKCRWCYEQHKHAGKEEKGRVDVASEGATLKERLRDAMDAGTLDRLASRLESADREKKRVEGIGPHTSASNTQGCTCDTWTNGPTCDYCTPATHHATRPTQVLENKGPDTTSHG